MMKGLTLMAPAGNGAPGRNIRSPSGPVTPETLPKDE